MKFRRRNNADGNMQDDEDSGLSGSAGHDMPPSPKSKSHPAAAHGLPAPVAAMAAFTMLMIVLTCGVIAYKHRQFLTARGHLEQHYAAKMQKQTAALQAELKAYLEHIAQLRDVADEAEKASKQCTVELRTLKRETNQLAGQKQELSQELQAGRQQLVEAKLTLESEHKRLSAANTMLEQDKRQMQWVNDQASKMGLLKHVVRLGTAHDMEQHKDLAVMLKQIANKNKEVLMTVCGHSATGPDDYLTPWLDGIARSGLENALVIATDAATLMKAKQAGANAIYFAAEAQIVDGPNAHENAHAVRKFKAIRMVLSMGYSVLYTDLDVVLTGNPFDHLMRDVDVEVMSDSWDDSLAYGRTEVWQDPQSGDHLNIRIAGVSPGLLYLRPLQANLDLTQQLLAQLASGKDSEAAALDKLLLTVPHGADGPADPAIDPSPTRLRILPQAKYMTSKALFGSMARDSFLSEHNPVAIHVNYHSDKMPRIAAIVARYRGDPKALEQLDDRSPGVSGKKVPSRVGSKRSMWLL